MAIKTNSWILAETGAQMSASYSNIDRVEWTKSRSINNDSIGNVNVMVRHYYSSQSRVDGYDPVLRQSYQFSANLTGSIDSFFGEVYDKLKEHTDGPFSGSIVTDD
jgi:hypothetical protein